MLKICTLRTTLLLILFGLSCQSLADSDCLLQGTVQKTGEDDSSRTQVKFHSIDSYDEKSRCKIRRDKKMKFKLPNDPRLQDAPDGSEVKYRYRSQGGERQTELISVGT